LEARIPQRKTRHDPEAGGKITVWGIKRKLLGQNRGASGCDFLQGDHVRIHSSEDGHRLSEITGAYENIVSSDPEFRRKLGVSVMTRGRFLRQRRATRQSEPSNREQQHFQFFSFKQRQHSNDT
jgi:hypothetical protein